jgi:hypothetical protein
VVKETWGQNKHLNELTAPPSVDVYLVEKMDALHSRLEWIKAYITELDGVNFEEGRLYVHRLEKNVPEIAREYSLSLYQLIPRVKLTDLLMEVASWTGFEKQLLLQKVCVFKWEFHPYTLMQIHIMERGKVQPFIALSVTNFQASIRK